MKQIITIVIAFMASLIANANYTSLSFRTVGGETHHLEITGLEISFAQENLIASNLITSITIPLAQLEYMEFSDNSSLGAVNTISTDKLNEKTTVYALNGVKVGTFASFSEAMNNITNGIFLFKYPDGTTLKIVKNENI